jgi:hypothetical protein
MEILLLIVAWILVGCGIAWVMGAAISVGDAPVGKRASARRARENVDNFPPGEGAPRDAGAELSPAAGTDRRRLCDCRMVRHRSSSPSEK